ncbi:ricin-type beta-trefoil lectin domain protein [Nonomuraea fuscirosea]|uniref:RICIN domain-containing protein n=1 Tax=Nonomuraea fuscirosea TaxID=1291556 RepID=UPI002DDA91B5|nr:RICIN domain-containing protein [Nonomuraea fuscirosea]WSA52282.1 ricin-type beta-trefoil lectin domain protein [Nonomuraea fuscirosea]
MQDSVKRVLAALSIAATGVASTPAPAAAGAEFSLKVQGTGQCLDTPGNNMTVVTKNCSTASTQLWFTDSTGILKNYKTGLCLDVNTSSKVVFANTCNGHLNQKWSFRNEGDGAYKYRIYNRGQYRYLYADRYGAVKVDVVGSTAMAFNWQRFS